GPLHEMREALQKAEDSCSASLAAMFAESLSNLSVAYLTTVGITAFMMLFGLLLGPETLGLGTLLMLVLSERVGQASSYFIASELARINRSIGDLCAPPPDEENDQQPAVECAPEWALVPASLGGPACQPIADPTYIHDPSGF